MNRPNYSFFTLGICLCLLAAAANALGEEHILTVGDDAPRLETGKFLRGNPFATWEKGKTYLIEFWNTGCEPCRLSMVSLNGLRQRFQDKNLTILAQNCWEEHFEAINDFLKSVSADIQFEVALDKTSRTNRGTMAHWLDAAHRGAIPAAFVINKDGKIAWIGSPIYLSEPELRKILDGTHDLAGAAAKYERARSQEQPLQAAMLELNKAIRAQQWEAAAKALARARQAAQEGEQDTLDLAQYQILLGQKDHEGAYQFAAQMGKKYHDNALIQNEIAWQIANDNSVSGKALSLADSLATRANNLAKEKNPGILDTLARVRFVRGDRAGAIAAEEKAIEVATGQTKTQLKQVLAAYQRGENPRGK